MKAKTVKRLETIERIKPELEPTFIHLFAVPVGIPDGVEPCEKLQSVAQAEAIAKGYWRLMWNWSGDEWIPDEMF